MTEFEQRLQRAIARGQKLRADRERAEADAALSEEELRRRHSDFRLQLSEHVEQCLHQLPNHFPGFQYVPVASDRGWGAAVSRDDVAVSRGGRDNLYSRLEMTVRPFASIAVLEVTARGTIRNKEMFNRNYYQKLAEVDLDSFFETVDLWVLEYAQLYAAQSS